RRTATSMWSRIIWCTRVIGSPSCSATSGRATQSAGSVSWPVVATGLVTPSICHVPAGTHHGNAAKQISGAGALDCLPMDAALADARTGGLIDGRYRIRGRVARGGMATVYTAVDERLERTVALKIIHPTHSGDPRFLDRFTEEAKTIARLTHPNVVAVYDQGV